MSDFKNILNTIKKEDSESIIVPSGDKPNWYDGFVFINNIDNAEATKICKPFYFENMKENSNRIKILLQWGIACKYVIREFVNWRGIDSITWRYGWVFDKETGAVHKKITDDSHALLVNPVDAEGNLKYSVRSKESHARLITLACHEVCHISSGLHNEYYANLLTELVARTMPKLSEIHQSMLAIL
jgi:hypothetical protein